jgi:hypothetical protein
MDGGITAPEPRGQVGIQRLAPTDRSTVGAPVSKKAWSKEAWSKEAGIPLLYVPA